MMHTAIHDTEVTEPITPSNQNIYHQHEQKHVGQQINQALVPYHEILGLERQV